MPQQDPTPQDPYPMRGGVNMELVQRLSAETARANAAEVQRDDARREASTVWHLSALLGCLMLMLALSDSSTPASNKYVDASVEEPWYTREEKPLMEKRRDINEHSHDMGMNRCTEITMWTHLVIYPRIIRGHDRRPLRLPRVERWSKHAVGVCTEHPKCTCPGAHPFLGGPLSLLAHLPHPYN